MILKLSHNLYYKVNNMKKTIQYTMKSVIKINIEIRMKASRRYIYNTFSQNATIVTFNQWFQTMAHDCNCPLFVSKTLPFGTRRKKSLIAD